MFAKVHFLSLPEREALTVPREAIVGSMREPKIYVVENGVARLKNITIGAENGTSVEVISGVSSSDTIVTTGQNNLRDGQEVKVVNN
jgi:hypothetical protein